MKASALVAALIIRNIRLDQRPKKDKNQADDKNKDQDQDKD